jgi:uncharacterized protein YdeI (YjbR/CyaY-like superfamily)
VVIAHREQTEPADRVQWRAWLAEHHATSPGVWVVLHRTEPGQQRLGLDGAVEEALCFGWIDSTLRSLGDGRRALLFTPRRPGGTWSRTNKQRVARLAAQGLMTAAGQAAVERARSDGSWSILDDIDALTIPPDLDAALAADPRARAGFEAQTASQKKSALWWIASARRPQTRARRIAETAARTAGVAPPGQDGSKQERPER